MYLKYDRLDFQRAKSRYDLETAEGRRYLSYLEMDGVDPLILLSIRESIIENDIELEKIKFDIFQNYIRLLDTSGKISEKPLRNYLSMNKDIMAK